jgi:hypothetical protein
MTQLKLTTDLELAELAASAAVARVAAALADLAAGGFAEGLGTGVAPELRACWVSYHGDLGEPLLRALARELGPGPIRDRLAKAAAKRVLT